MNPRYKERQPTLLYEEFRLVEKSESEVSSTWKSGHILLFFLSFVFGSFCTFCFHMLMFMFDEKCVLFPKLLSVSSQRHSKIFDYLPIEQEMMHALPVDFLSTQWVDQNVCYLPTYLPLISGIFGLVWITMFIMCSSGGYHTGLQRPWRALLPLFVFSCVFGILCIYTSIITHCGLAEFCQKLSEATNSPTCSFTINVVTLLYERRISGVYQATRLTIMSAWVHTACWVLSAGLVVMRVILAVDFQLVRVKALLYADTDVMLQQYEKQLQIVLPDSYVRRESNENNVTPPCRSTKPLLISENENIKQNQRRDIRKVRMSSLRKPKNDIFVDKMLDDLIENVFQQKNTRLQK